MSCFSGGKRVQRSLRGEENGVARHDAAYMMHFSPIHTRQTSRGEACRQGASAAYAGALRVQPGPVLGISSRPVHEFAAESPELARRQMLRRLVSPPRMLLVHALGIHTRVVGVVHRRLCLIQFYNAGEVEAFSTRGARQVGIRQVKWRGRMARER